MLRASLQRLRRLSTSPPLAVDRRGYIDKSDLKAWRRNYPPPLEVSKRGADVINDPLYNKGTNFGPSERDRMNLRGLVPPKRLSIEQQVRKIYMTLKDQGDNLEKNIYLQALQNRNETLYFKVLIDHIEEMAPLVYTPTVGLVCQKFGATFQRTRGMYFSSADQGAMAAMTYNWPYDDVQIIVITDGSRILGLGDLGANGMGIPIGKLALYSAAGGIHPRRVLPVMFDAGTNNKALLNDEFYLGMSHPRLKGQEYFSLLDEAICALKSRWPNALIQFEDFASEYASTILQTYRKTHLCFNDDIQGTGAVTLAGVLCGLRKRGLQPSDIKNQRIVVCGAGSAGLGVATTLLQGMVVNGLTTEEAQRNFWVCDQFGLMHQKRGSTLTKAQTFFARKSNDDQYTDQMQLLDVIKKVKPHILIGLTATRGVFSEECVREMAKHVDRPIIFPLSNPSSCAECTAEEAYNWTDGKAIFASGSPYNPVTIKDKTYYPSQCNNMFIFPGVGLGATLAGAMRVTDRMFYAAAEALAKSVDINNAKGLVFPPVSDIREVSTKVASSVIQLAIEENIATDKEVQTRGGESFEDFVRSRMYEPRYAPLVYVEDPHTAKTWYS